MADSTQPPTDDSRPDNPVDMLDEARQVIDQLRSHRARTIAERQMLDEAADLLETFVVDREYDRRRMLDEYHADRELDAAMDAVTDDPDGEARS